MWSPILDPRREKRVELSKGDLPHRRKQNVFYLKSKADEEGEIQLDEDVCLEALEKVKGWTDDLEGDVSHNVYAEGWL